jgi:hypothetical protein
VRQTQSAMQPIKAMLPEEGEMFANILSPLAVYGIVLGKFFLIKSSLSESKGLSNIFEVSGAIQIKSPKAQSLIPQLQMNALSQ